jgi:two-component system, chemotaxis family, sensor kinase CheA
MSEFQVSPELLAIYIEDARGHLEALDHCLLTLEREGLDADVISSVLGPLHTLKGNSGMMGFAGIKDYVHRLEDVFAQMSDGELKLAPALFDQLFAGASALRAAVETAGRTGADDPEHLGAERAALDGLVLGTPSEATRRSAAAPSAAAKPLPIVPTAAAPPREAPSAPASPAPVVPAPAPKAPAAEPGSAPLPGRKGGDAAYIPTRSNMVRVDFSQLDQLLNLVGELIIFRTKLHQAAKEMAERLGARDAGREMLEAVHQVAGVSGRLQETVMDIRMLPIRHVFERFPRLVRDLARQQGKEIELILEGETTRVDKAIIDEIGEPLVHLIRNSVDHGIETPQVRVSRGKTPTGTILLSAAQESNHVVITIMDDGAGIDANRVRAKAITRGLLRGDETLSDREAVQLIFSHGFSTADAVTEVSGRGVGLDVVLKSIERLNGLVEVETVPEVGTKFIIQLPLTLAIISALLVEVGGRAYAIPLGSVVESIKFELSQVHRIHGRDALRIRDRIVPVVRLADLFGLRVTARAEREYAVILGRGEKRVALVVDRLQGQQEVVIKALDPAVSGGTVAVAGATIMGDGRVVLILDVAALFEGKRHALVHGRDSAAAVAGDLAELPSPHVGRDGSS